jgi:hypothetical protein
MELDTHNGSTPKWTRERKIRLSIVLAPLLLMLPFELFSGATLVSGIPLWLYFFAIACGAAYSYFVIKHIQVATGKSKPPTPPQIVSFIGIYSLGFAPYLMRQIILFMAFVFINPPTANENYVIDGTLGRKGPDRVTLIPKDFEGRSISAFATSELTDLYFHISTHGKDCIGLLTQTGFGGVRRAETPSFYDYLFNNGGLSPSMVRNDCASA